MVDIPNHDTAQLQSIMYLITSAIQIHLQATCAACQDETSQCIHTCNYAAYRQGGMGELYSFIDNLEISPDSVDVLVKGVVKACGGRLGERSRPPQTLSETIKEAKQLVKDEDMPLPDFEHLFDHVEECRYMSNLDLIDF